MIVREQIAGYWFEWDEEKSARCVRERGFNFSVAAHLDQDVLKWLRSKGPGYQTKVNLLLRLHMLEERTRKKAS